jgi:hypothetical protein
MPVFAVIAPAFDERLDSAVKQNFSGSNILYEIAPGQYLISAARMTTKQLAEKLGIIGGGVGRVLVLRLGNYTGWHAKDMWEWIESQLSAPPPATTAGESPDE